MCSLYCIHVLINCEFPSSCGCNQSVPAPTNHIKSKYKRQDMSFKPFIMPTSAPFPFPHNLPRIASNEVKLSSQAQE